MVHGGTWDGIDGDGMTSAGTGVAGTGDLTPPPSGLCHPSPYLPSVPPDIYFNFNIVFINIYITLSSCKTAGYP